MRRNAVKAMVLTVFALTGCGAAHDTAPSKPEHLDGVANSDRAQKIADYTTLAEDFNGFFAAVITATARSEVEPKTVDDVRDLVQYDFADGVELAEWNDDGVCLTGPHNTYVSLTTESTTKRAFGTGDCDPTQTHIVLVADDQDIFARPENVIKGETLVNQIPAITDWHKTALEAARKAQGATD